MATRHLIVAMISCLICIDASTYGQTYNKTSTTENLDGQKQKIIMVKTFDIESLEGKKEQILIINDYNRDQIQAVYLKDTTRLLGNFYGEVTASYLNKNFLRVLYSIHGGTGAHAKYLSLLNIENGKLNVSLQVLAQATDYDGYNILDGLYQIKTNVRGHRDTANFQLTVNFHDMEHYRYSPKKSWHDYHRTTTLKFDKRKDIFYNKLKYINEVFTIYNTGTNKESKTTLKGTFPVVDIDKNESYFINGAWYDIADNNMLVQYTSQRK